MRCLAVLTTVFVAACGQLSPQDYAANEPLLVPEEFFNGKLTAHGVIKNRGGKVVRYFNADIDASWKNGVGTLDEHFLFDDGERQQRIWTLSPAADGSYSGTAGDVVGEGRLEYAGNSVFLDYVLRIPYRDGTVDVRVDDRMYLVQEDLLINESVMTKFGIEVGSILLVIRRLDDTQ